MMKSKFLTILLIGIFMLSTVSATWYLPWTWFQNPEENPQQEGQLFQITKEAQWNVLKLTGEESGLIFWTANAKDKKTEMGFLLPKGEKCSDWETALNVYDNTGSVLKNSADGKDIKPLTCKSAGCDKQDCYYISLTNAQSSNLQDINYIKLGEHSIVVEYQNISMLLYNLSFGQAEITLFKNISNSWNNTVNDLFVHYNKDNYKFGATDNSEEEETLNNYKYQLKSTTPIYKNENVLYVQNPEMKTTGSGVNTYHYFENHDFDFVDICSKGFNPYNTTEWIGNESYIITRYNQTAQCQFNSYEVYIDENTTNYFYEVTFISDKDIDPTITIGSSDWITTSYLNNVTAETGKSNHTHLNVSNTAPYDSLVGYWSADGDLADTKLTKAYDWSGEGNDGTMGGDTVATSSAGKFGKGFSFDGAGDYIYLTTFNTLYNQNQTWSFWIKKLESKKQIFFDVKDSNNVRLLTAGEYLGNLVISRTNTLNTTYTIHGDNIDTGWHNVILVYNSSNDSNRFRIFVDGVDTSSSASSYFGTRGAASQMKIGGRLDSTSYFNGSIDDVMFFNTSLTSDQISDIYNNQSARHKSTGTQDIINQNYMNISSGNNKVNVSTNIQNNLGSGINLSVGYYDGSWHSTSSQVIVSGVNNTFDISSTSTNLTLNYTFIAGDYDFYSPILEGDIEFEAWSEEELGENPSVVFDETTDYGETNENYFFVNVTASDVGRGVGNVSTFVDLNNSLIAWWRMDDGNATNVFDYFGEYNGTLQNTPTKVTGVLGDAYQFDNDSLDYIDFGDMSVAEDKTFTYTLWMKTIQDSSGAYIMSEGNTINDAPLVAIYLYNGKVVGAIRNDTYGAVNLYSTFDVNDDEWHFVAYTSGDTYSRLYVDGIEEASNIAGSGTITLDTMSLGALRRGSVVSYFNGSIDDVTVWDRDLSFEEVVGLYANQSTKYMENIYDNLNAGTYNFTAYAQNTAGNINKTEEKSILVNAIDASPYFLDIPENSTLETGESLEVDFRATDGNFNKGVWTWFNSPVAIESNNQTFIGWVNSNGDVVIFQYNKTNQEKSSYILSYAFEVDDHANPAITILPNGKILVTWSKHGYKSYYRVSVNPYNISSWTARTEMPNNPPGVTNVAYSNAFYLGNEDLVYNYYRYNESGIAFSKYNYTNDSWTSATSMLSDSEVQTAVNRTYTQFWSDDNDTIHFFATNGHPGYKQTDVFHMYYKNGNYYQTNGTLIGGDEVLPLSTSDITPIDTNSYKTWTSDIKVFDDMPYVVYPTYADINNITYVFGRWNQSEDTWQIFNITGSEGTGLYSPEIHYGVDYYTAGITIDEYDPSIVYLGSNVTGIYEIEQWETDDNGETWVKTKNITKDSTYHNFRPYTIKNASDELNLLWVGDGLYTSFAEYDTNIVSNQIDLDINHAVKYYVDDTTNFTIDINYGILENKTALSIGTYILNITINDTEGNINWTLYQVDVEDTTSPTYSLNQTNNTVANQSTLFSLYWNDGIALHTKGQYIFSTNNTGVWTNDSAVSFSATPSWANVTKVLNSTVGISVGFRWYANDSAGNWNVSEIFSLTTTNAADTSFTVSLPIGYTEINFSSNNKTVSNLNAEGQNSTSGVLLITNTGNVGLDIFLNINSTDAGFVLFADTDNNPSGATILNSTSLLLKDNLASSSSQNLWLFLNWTEKIPQIITKLLNTSVTEN